jgi:tripartite-type tricarboxylate transporter receptor subunit TctC
MNTAISTVIRTGAALLLSAASVTALAQAYPAKPVRIINNYTPGGTTDFVARAMATKLSEALGQPFTVENKPSANGTVGSLETARSRPDGYTLLFSTSGHTSIPMALMGPKLPFNPREFTPIILLIISNQSFVVHPSLGVKNIPEFVKLMKANPGKYSYGSAGPGSPNHLGVELLKYMAGFYMVHIPYKGGAQAVVDLVAGRTVLMLNSNASLMPHIRAGKIIPIAVSANRRSTAVPDVLPIAQQGYPDFDIATWYGMFGPPGLPRDITAKLNAVMNTALKAPDIIKSFEAQGAEPMGGTPEDLGKKLLVEYERWRKVVEFAKIEAD